MRLARKPGAMLVAAAAMLAGRGSAGAANVEPYPDIALHRPDAKVTGTVGGRPVTFEHFRTSKEYWYDVRYAWFAADGPVSVELKLIADVPIRQARLARVGGDIPLRQDGATLAFTLPGAGNYYLQLPDLGRPVPDQPDSGTYTVLFFVDDLKARRGDKPVGAADVTALGVVSDPDRDQTEAIQLALERAESVHFPAGIYRTAGLKVPSNRWIHLAPGAVIQAVGDETKVHKPFVDLTGAAGVRIRGPGTIDAGGHALHVIQTDGSRDIALEDVLVRNCASWAIHLLNVDRALVRNVRVLSGKDGIDPDCARDVTIEGCCIMSKDDSIAVKTRKPPATTQRIAVRNCIVASDASALKVGTETRAMIRDVTFEDCEVFDSDRGIILYARDGGPVENVVWRNVRMRLIDWPHETRGAPFQFTIKQRGGATPVRGCLVENVRANCLVSSTFAGLAQAPLNGLAMRNITLCVESPAAGERPPLLVAGPHVSVTLEGLRVDWQGRRELWGEVASGAGLKVQMAGP